jgi:hypothetical protein
MFWKLGLFLSSDEGRETSTLLGLLERANLQWLRLALCKGPNRTGVFLSSHEDGNRSSF